MNDRLVSRAQYREAYGINDETVRRDLKAGRLPPFDEAPTRKRQAWYASTLVRAGKLLFADPTSQPTPCNIVARSARYSARLYVALTSSSGLWASCRSIASSRYPASFAQVLATVRQPWPVMRPL